MNRYELNLYLNSTQWRPFHQIYSIPHFDKKPEHKVCVIVKYKRVFIYGIILTKCFLCICIQRFQVD